MTKKESIKQLQTMINIGPVAANELYSMGIRSPEQLKKSNPEELYEKLKRRRGGKLDRCVLYQFRGAIKNKPWPECKE